MKMSGLKHYAQASPLRDPTLSNVKDELIDVTVKTFAVQLKL